MMDESPTTPPSPNNVSAIDLITIVINAGGNMHLAAERAGIPFQRLAAIIAQNPVATKSLNAQLRTLALFDNFEALRAARDILIADMPKMEPREVLKAFEVLTTTVQALTDERSQTTQINVIDTLMTLVPPDVRIALTNIMQANTTPPQPQLAFDAPNTTDPHKRAKYTIEDDYDDYAGVANNT